MEPLETRLLLAAGPAVISEFMAVNDGTLADGDGDFSDWIELHNPTDARVYLDGWYLTDDAENLTKWRFPNVWLDADRYEIVFASGKADNGPAGELHTNFRLDGDGEYLALVRADGSTIAQEFAPEFPEQREDVSYGASQDAAAFTLEGARLAYRVPSAGDEALGTSWTTAGFDDAAWSEYAPPARVLISEAGTGDPDFVEIQNLSGQSIDTSGWVVAVNDAYDIGHPADINAFNSTLWHLPASVAADEVLFRRDIDAGDGNYWGSNIFWRTYGPGWAMVIDDGGRVADFVVWGYDQAQIAAFDVTIAGHRVTAEGVWNGDSIPLNVDNDYSQQRGGVADHDDASDWTSITPITVGEQNEGLTVPFAARGAPGIGFETQRPGLSGEIEIDVQAEMLGVNSSLWARFPFQVDDPSVLDAMQLQIRYNDGFVAYVNGQEVASRNAPDVVHWNSAATAARSDPESLSFELIDVSEALPLLHGGTNVLAVQAMNFAAADADFLVLPQLAVSSPRYFGEPTPGGPNGSGFQGFVADTQFSVDRGFFDGPLEVEITSDTPGAVVYYSLDGGPPTEETGIRYSGPISISTTTMLRAAAFKPDYRPTNVDTQTYIFPAHLASQNGAGLPQTWGVYTYGGQAGQPVPADYRFDRGITDLNDLRTIPSLSLVVDPDDLWGGQRGIYAHPLSEGITWERAGSLELIDADGSTEFQLDSGVRIHGGWGRRPSQNPKHSFRLLFKRDYGATKLDYPLFGDEATDSFDTIVLRAGFNDSWATGAGSGESYIQDRWAAQTQNDMGGWGPHGTWVHLYLNGLYWGLYNPVERPNASFGAAYFGGDKEDYDSYRTFRLIDGNSTSWNQLFNLVRQGSINYAAVGQRLDIPNFLDYLITNQFGGNWDWPQNNWYATARREPLGKWRFHSWDAEGCISDVNSNRVNNYGNNGPGEIYQRLRNVEQFRRDFGDRVHRHLFNGGLLTSAANVQRINEIAAVIDRAIVGEAARWGHGMTRGNWVNRINWLRNTYFPQRPAVVLGQYRAAGLYPDVDAPRFNRHGGQVPVGFNLTMSVPGGTIYYTLDGTDPRLPGATRYVGSPLTLRESTLVKSRAYSQGEWSALNEAEFFVHEPASATNLVVSEIHYFPPGPTPGELALDASLTAADFEFIELANVGDDSITLQGVRFTDGIDFDFSGGDVEVLQPGGRVVVAADSAAFRLRYPGAADNLAGEFARQLSNQGEQVELTSNSAELIFSFAYDNGGDWPGRAEGKGASLELIDPSAVPVAEPQRTDFLEDDVNWRSSSEFGGSPGVPGTGPAGDVVVNEVLTHTDPPQLDTIELHNTTDAAIELGGWYLSDSWGWPWDPANGNYRKFRVPDGTSIPAHGYVVFDESDFNPTPGNPLPTHFALDGAHGDDVWLMEAGAGGELLRFVDHVEFGAAANGESWGRWPDGSGELYPMSDPTLDKQRPQDGLNSGPRVGPVIISELQYNPEAASGDDDFEFVEIYNNTSQAVELANWRIRGGIDYDFSAGTVLGAYSQLVVVPFELTDAEKLSAFRGRYNINASVELAGGYTDRLADGGERVRLQRPDEEPADEPGFYPRLLEDEVTYDDQSPWPTGAAGGGDSLHRRAADKWGNSPGNWADRQPTPGRTPYVPPIEPEVVGRHVFYNGSAFDGNNSGAGPQDDAAIAPDKVPLLPGQTASFANYTSFGRGLVGIMIDIAGMPPFTLPGADAFRFRVGNDDDPDGWADAPIPSVIIVRQDQGNGGSERVTVLWPSNVIQNQWLQVTVLAGGLIGLAEDDVFYFGNAIGESGDSAIDAKVSAVDMLAARDNQRSFLDPAPIDFAFDYNRDARVNTSDMLIARNNQTHFLTALRLITAPGVKAAGGNAAADQAGWINQYQQQIEADRPLPRGGPQKEAADAAWAADWP